MSIPGFRTFADAAKHLSKNPLGIVALFLLLVYGIAGLVTGFSGSFTSQERLPLIWFLFLFPFAAFGGFCWLVSQHSGKLYAPSDFRDDANYLQAVRAVAVAEFSRPDNPLQGEVQLAIASIEPKTLSNEGAAQEAEPTAAEALQPKAHWKRAQYEFAYIRLILRKKSEDADAISDAYLRTEQAEQADNAVTWEAFRLVTLVRYSDEDSFEELKNFAETNPTGKVREFLAFGYMHYADYKTATAIFRDLANQATDKEEAARLLGFAARCAAKAGDPEQADQIINEIKKSNPGELRFPKVPQIIREVAKILEDDDALIAALEQIVDANPGDSQARFSLAYQHTACGNRDMALAHYLRIPVAQRTSEVWNNLGVEFDHWKLPAMAVEAFKCAEDMGETLAAANLADKLINTGFLDEARARCLSAMKAESPHKNVSATLTRLQDVPEAEDKQLAAITEKAKQAIDFYREMGEAISLPNISEIASLWSAPECQLTATLQGKQFTALGSYEVEATGGLGLFSALSGIGSEMPRRFRLEYQGTIKGHSIWGSVKRRREDAPEPLLGTLNDTAQFLMVLSGNGRQIRVMQGPENHRRFYVWSALHETA